AAADALRSEARTAAPVRSERRGAQTAWLFPGQGAQHAGMAAGLHAHEPIFRQAFDRCAEILRPALGLDLQEAVLRGEDEALQRTELAQPALFAVEWSLAALWGSWGVRPAAMAGHSIGEFVAACLAGVFTLEDALGLVAERGRLMGSMPAGAMLAAALPETALAALCARLGDLSVAAVNGPSSCVASGPEEAVRRLESELERTGVACRRLRTSHAFHSAMMDPVVAPFEQRVRRARLSPPAIPFLSNVTGGWIAGDQAADPAYWASHLRQPVRFADNLAALAADTARVLLEAGPGTSLGSLARAQAGPDLVVVSSMRHPGRGVSDREALLEAAGRLWCAGVDLDPEALHPAGRRVALPGYPFRRDRHWIDPAGAAADRSAAPSVEEEQGKNPDRAAWFYVPGWRSTPWRAPRPEPDRRWLVLGDEGPLALAVAAEARAAGAAVVPVRAGAAFEERPDGSFTVDPGRRADFEALLRTLASSGPLPDRIVHLWCSGPDLHADAAQRLGFFALVHLTQALGQAAAAHWRLAVAAGGLFDVIGEPVRAPHRATLAGIVRVIPQEYPGVSARLIDTAEDDPDSSARRLAEELADPGPEPIAAWRGGRRWVPCWTQVRAGEPPGEASALFRPGAAWLLTGGTGPLELAVAARLAASGGAGVAFLECDPSSEAAVRPLRDAGIDVICSGARTGDPAAVREAAAAARARFGRLDVVLHTAGSIDGGMIQLKDRAAAERVLRPRLAGAPALRGSLREGETLVLFSSAISATGLFGQADYCAASCLLDALAREARPEAAGPRVVSLGWGTALWDRWQPPAGPGSAALLDQLRAMQARIGITVEEGVEALERALALGEPHVVISPQDLHELIEQSAAASVTEFLEGVGRPAAAAARRAGAAPVEPETPTERAVAGIWTSLLGVSPIGRRDNFFDLGGNSLLAIQLASTLRKSFEIDLTIASLFEASDLAALAAAVDRGLEERRAAEEVARLLDEIEALTPGEIQAELTRAAQPAAAE
ncbi:MAG TPA: SDR family NAD(P)-dependent oxidoreductase, partial [Candidatus Polarisedimenticolia bacterium]|nr:SDR family NAD(P)-dependent oxidoreductase [Candidatus Polarisedimenticolia bacterium]